jgi:hypothetical protein
MKKKVTSLAIFALYLASIVSSQLVQTDFPIKIGLNDASSCDTVGSTFDVDAPYSTTIKQLVVVGGKSKSKALLESKTGCYTDFMPFIQIFSQYNPNMGLAATKFFHDTPSNGGRFSDVTAARFMDP